MPRMSSRELWSRIRELEAEQLRLMKSRLEFELMAQEVLRLKGREKYVQHLPECETEMKPVWLTADGPPQCTCGLTDLG